VCGDFVIAAVFWTNAVGGFSIGSKMAVYGTTRHSKVLPCGDDAPTATTKAAGAVNKRINSFLGAVGRPVAFN